MNRHQNRDEMESERLYANISSDSSAEDISSTCSVSSEERIQHWKQIAKSLSMRERTIRREFQEYQENSTAYEGEMESLYRQTEQINRKLCQANEELEEQNKTLKGKLNTTSALVNSLQAELQKVKMENEKLSKYNRLLETNNEKLEQMNREIKILEEEKDYQLNETIERLALLETDLEENLNLREAVQRLKDENRDLLHHIKIEKSRNHSISSFEEPSNNDADISMNLSLHERVSLMDKKLNNYNNNNSIKNNNNISYRSDTSSRSSHEGRNTSKVNNENAPVADTDIKQNFKAVIDQLKESKNPLTKKRKHWSFRATRPVRDESPPSFTGDEYFLKRTNYEPERKKESRGGFLGWWRKKN